MKTNVWTLLLRHVSSGVAFGVGVLAGSLLMLFVLTVLDADKIETTTEQIVSEMEVAAPTALSVPSVGITATFSNELGVNDDQTVEVPEDFDSVGLFSYGPKPGEVGPAVVLGHVDSVDGPAIFYDLRNVAVGDAVLIDRADGTTATFVVTRKQYRSQATFPTEEVYGDLEYPGLRLITCSGSFAGDEQAYSHNLIVYARFVSEGITNG